MSFHNNSRRDEQPTMPHGFGVFLWVIRNWKKYYKELISFLLVILFIYILSQWGIIFIAAAIRSYFSSVTMKVVRFDHSTGELSMEFFNDTQMPVPLDHLYITIEPTNNVPAKQLPPDLQQYISVYDRSALRIPPGAGAEIGAISYKHTPAGRKIRITLSYIRPNQSLFLPPGHFTTNIVPPSGLFSQICQQYEEGAEIQVCLNTSLIDPKGRTRITDNSLGCCFSGSRYTGFRNELLPTNIDIFKHAKRGGSKQLSYIYTGDNILPTLGEDVRIVLLENQGSSDLLLKIGDNIAGLIPVLLINNSIAYGCHFNVELMENEALSTNLSTWVLTSDGGKTVFNVPTAFSSRWSNIQLIPNPGEEYSIPLLSSNWMVLVNGTRWANINDGSVKYYVKQKIWQNIISANDATYGTLFSNYNNIAIQEIVDDKNWIPISEPITLSSNFNNYIIIQNEVMPDLALFSSQLFSATSTTASVNIAPQETIVLSPANSAAQLGSEDIEK